MNLIREVRAAPTPVQLPTGVVEQRGEGTERVAKFLSAAPLTAGYLAWAALWVAMIWGLAAVSFVRKDL